MYRLEICVYEVYVSQRADARGLGARSPVDVCKLDLRLDESEMSDGVLVRIADSFMENIHVCNIVLVSSITLVPSTTAR